MKTGVKNILITAPSLDEKENVSGISTIVKSIMDNKQERVRLFHFRLGKKDGQGKNFAWMMEHLFLLPRLAYFLLKNKIDHVHINTGFEKASIVRDFSVFALARYIFRCKAIFHIHGGYYLMQAPKKGSIYRFLISRMLKDSSVKIVLSEIERKRILEDYQVECDVLPNAIDTTETLSTTKNFSEKLQLTFLGRLVRSKGIFEIAAAMKSLKPFYDQFELHIYGAGDETESFLAELNALGGLNYSYKGVARGKEKWNALKSTHVFLLPSVSSEGLPIAMLEAMGSGCIPVVSNDASITTVVNDNVNGYVIRKGDTEHLKQVLQNILHEPSRLEQISHKAYSTIKEKYNISDYVSTLNGYYTQLSN